MDNFDFADFRRKLNESLAGLIDTTGWTEKRLVYTGDGGNPPRLVVPGLSRDKKGMVYCHTKRADGGGVEQVLQVINNFEGTFNNDTRNMGHAWIVGKPPGKNELYFMVPDGSLAGEVFGGASVSQTNAQIALNPSPDRLNFLRLFPAGGLSIGISAGWWRKNNDLIFIETQQLGSLAAYVPSTAGQSCYVLVCFDGSDMQVVAGTPFPTSSNPDPINVMPTTAPAGYPVNGAVKLTNGVSTINQADIIPLPELISHTAGAGGSGDRFVDLVDTPMAYTDGDTRIVAINGEEVFYIDQDTLTEAYRVVSDENYPAPNGSYALRGLTNNSSLWLTDMGSATVTASSGANPERVHDADLNNSWSSANTGGAKWLEINYGSGKNRNIQYLYLHKPPSTSAAPTSFQVQYHNGSTWQTVFTKSGETWGAATFKNYHFANANNAYRWRLYITDWEGSGSSNVVQVAELSFFTASYNAEVAQSFKAPSDGQIHSIDLYLSRRGSPSGNLQIRVYTDSSGQPDSDIGTSALVNMDDLQTDAGRVVFDFVSGPVLAEDAIYWCVLEGSNTPADIVNPAQPMVSVHGYILASGLAYPDGEVKLLLGGQSSYISPTGSLYDLRFAIWYSRLTSTLVKVTAEDTTAGYLSDKIDAGSNITLAIINPGANEKLRITSAGGGGGGAPDDAKYIVQEADGDLPNAQALAALGTGIVKNTTATGVLSIASAGTDYLDPSSSLDPDNLSSVVPTSKGGTGQDFSASSGLVKLTAGAASTVTAPAGDVVGTSDSQTLSSKTLTTPTIADFTNAQHDHEDAAGGGTLSASAIASGTLDNARLGDSGVVADTYKNATVTVTAKGLISAASSNPFMLVGWNDYRLSLDNADPNPAGVTGATSVYLHPYIGNAISIFDGSEWDLYAPGTLELKLTSAMSGTTTSSSAVVTGLADTSQLVVGMTVSGTGVGVGRTIASIDSATQITMSSSATGSGTNTLTFRVPANINVDIFITPDEALVYGPLWTNATTRATSLARQDGVMVLSGSATKRYLGTVRTTSSAGQSEHSFGTSNTPRMFLWNYCNRVVASFSKHESSTSWSHTGAFDYWADSSSNRIEWVSGLDSLLSAEFYGYATSSSNLNAQVALALDSTTTMSAISSAQTHLGVSSTAGAMLPARFNQVVTAGYHYLAMLEATYTYAATFYGQFGGPPATMRLGATGVFEC